MKKYIKENSSIFILFLVGLLVAVSLGAAVGKSMYSKARLELMGYQIPEFGLLALGMMLSFLTGGIDLSIVAIANTAGIFGAYILAGIWLPGLPGPMKMVVGILVILVASLAFGAFNGVLIAKFSVPPMIATLGTMTLYSGIGLALTGGQSVLDFTEGVAEIGTAKLLGVPVIFYGFAVITAVIWFVLSRTAFGRKIYLYGGNPIAARFTAINNERLIISLYTLIGVLSGIAGFIIISRVGSAKVGYGDAYQIQAMLVAIIGGISPSGGKGKVSGVLLAILIMQILSSAFTIWQLSPYNRKLIWGAMMILVMMLNHWADRRSVRLSTKAA